MNLLTVISARSTYIRHKVLLDDLQLDPDINLSIFLTGMMEDNTISEIHKKYSATDYTFVHVDMVDRISRLAYACYTSCVDQC